MKKIKFKLLLLSFLTILSACNKSDSNINPNAQNVDYEFTITINGLSHKIKGNTVNGDPFGTIINHCYASNPSGLVLLGIKDVSASNYISGQVLGCTITLPNLALGVNNATLKFEGGYWTNLTDSLGGYSPFFGLSTTRGGSYSSGSTIPFNITDLGDAPTTYINPYVVYNHTKTCKGNFNGILYMVSKVSLKYDIPINISIDFKAVRMN